MRYREGKSHDVQTVIWCSLRSLESRMTFEEIFNAALAMLQRQGRVSYRALKRQFDLDDAYIEDLKFEIIEVHRAAVLGREVSPLLLEAVWDGTRPLDPLLVDLTRQEFLF